MVPNVAHRVLMRRMMMSSIPHLSANVLKWGKGFKGWTKGDKEAWMQCPCECGKAQHIWKEVDRELVRIVEVSCGDAVVAAWKAMSPAQRSEKVLSWKCDFSWEVEKAI